MTKLEKILDANIPWYEKLANKYLRRPILWDFCIGVIIVGINFLIVNNNKHLINFEKNSGADILNELISSTLSSGGFILAALAILASIKQNLSNGKESNSNKGKEFFFNSSGYKRIINIYSFACLVFLILFILFTILRSGIDHIPDIYTLNILIVGVTVLVLTLFRCIILLWILIKA